MPISEIIGHLVYGFVLNAFLFVTVAAWLARCSLPSPERLTRTTMEAVELFAVFGIVFSACIVVVVTVGGSLGWASNRLAERNPLRTYLDP